MKGKDGLLERAAQKRALYRAATATRRSGAFSILPSYTSVSTEDPALLDVINLDLAGDGSNAGG